MSANTYAQIYHVYTHFPFLPQWLVNNSHDRDEEESGCNFTTRIMSNLYDTSPIWWMEAGTPLFLLISSIARIKLFNILYVLSRGCVIIQDCVAFTKTEECFMSFKSWLEFCVEWVASLIARFMGPTWGPSGSGRTQVDPMLATWTLLSDIWMSCY